MDRRVITWNWEDENEIGKSVAILNQEGDKIHGIWGIGDDLKRYGMCNEVKVSDVPSYFAKNEEDVEKEEAVLFASKEIPCFRVKKAITISNIKEIPIEIPKDVALEDKLRVALFEVGSIVSNEIKFKVNSARITTESYPVLRVILISH